MRVFGKRAGTWFHRPQGAPSYDPHTTEEDVRACFRLLLGRAPNPSEWQGHTLRVGEPLPAVVASYLQSLEFSRRGLLRPDTVSGAPQVTQLPDFRVYSLAGDAAVGQSVQENGYEPHVSAVFRRLLREGMGVLDIGANIGYFALLSAAIVGPSGHVLAIEPNPGNARLLEISRRANGFENIVIAQVAAGRETGLLVLHSSFSNGTTSPPPEDEAALLASITVPCIRPDDLLSGAHRIDVIKADVEGAEYNALLGCQAVIARDRPTIISEFSPEMMPGISGIDGPGFLRWLAGLGYRLAVIEPDGRTTEASETAFVAEIMAEYTRRRIDHIDIVATPAEM